MGSWNETCALTHLPIRSGTPIVAITTVNGPRYKSTDSSALETALLFGLPVIGLYDDYGGIEDVTNPALKALNDSAFAASGYYKKVTTKESYGGQETRWVAAHRDTLWSLTDALKPLYYPELGMKLSEVSSYDSAAQEKSLAAFRLAQSALETLGDKLGTVTFSESKEAAGDELFAVFTEVFGDKAWGAFSAIQHKGLYASRSQLFMHKVAYDALVAEFGARKVGYHREAAKQSLRTHLATTLDDWLARFDEEFLKWSRLLQHGETEELAEDIQRKTFRMMRGDNTYSLLTPLTNLWMAPELPLVGHFWGGALPKEIMAIADKEQLVDYLVFQWARHYLRLDFKKSGAGSQNEETVLPNKIFKATIAQLTKDGQLKKDFSGTLFR